MIKYACNLNSIGIESENCAEQEKNWEYESSKMYASYKLNYISLFY